MQSPSFAFLIFLCCASSVFCYVPVQKSLTWEEIDAVNNEAKDQSKHNAVLDPKGDYKIQWSFDNDTVTFEIDVKTKGYAGLGFSPTAGMKDADAVFVWIDANGTGQISDRHVTKDHSEPELDKHQDYFLINATREDGRLKASFYRKRNTGDKEDYLLTSDTTRVIYAYNDKLPSEDGHFEYHGGENRGTKGLFLFEPSQTRANLPNDTITMDMTSQNLTWPNGEDTRYWCQVYEMPKIPMHHLLRMESIITPGNEPYVHHIAIYQCSEDMSYYLDKAGPCFKGDGSEGDFSPMYKCTSRLMFFWNKGMSPLNMPDDVGMPMFEHDNERHILLEVHYDNSADKRDLKDYSGFKLFLSPTPRPIEAGIMLLGTPENTFSQIIPPKEKSFHFYGFYDECLQTLPPNGTKFSHGFLHQHHYGTEIRVMHFRNGVQLPHILEDANHDFNYEQYRRVDPARVVLPGDNIVVDCVYDTTSRDTAVFGGYSTTKTEMCGATMLYYPRHASGFVCGNLPDPKFYVPIFGGRYIDDEYPNNFTEATVSLTTGQNVTLDDFIQKYVNWSAPGIHEKYQDFVTNGEHLLQFAYTPAGNHSSEGTKSLMLHHKGYPTADQSSTESTQTVTSGSSTGTAQSSPTDSPAIPTSPSMANSIRVESIMIIFTLIFSFVLCR